MTIKRWIFFSFSFLPFLISDLEAKKNTASKPCKSQKLSKEVFKPATLDELQSLVKEAFHTSKKISIVGLGKSQGGQTDSSDQSSLKICLSNLNKLISLDKKKMHVTVQAGMTWNELIRQLAPHILSVKSMQSYSDFSIGGSLSVNAHGRDFRNAPLIKTVKRFKLMNPDGTIISVSREENNELFRLALGGYGLFGIITEATLEITNDCLLTRKTASIKATELAKYFDKNVLKNPAAELYSARFSIGKDDLLKNVLVIWYEKNDERSSRLMRLKPQNMFRNFFARKSFSLMNSYPKLKDIRYKLESSLFSGNEVISRNNFMNEPLAGLPSDTRRVQYILQEYFLPYEQLNNFVQQLREVIVSKNINILNVTARHLNQDDEAMLSCAPKHCCSLVLYVAVRNNKIAYEQTEDWTRLLIDKALELNGSYYLPYHLLGTQTQLEKAYPYFKTFITLKQVYDPKGMFSNMFYEQYNRKV